MAVHLFQNAFEQPQSLHMSHFLYLTDVQIENGLTNSQEEVFTYHH